MTNNNRTVSTDPATLDEARLRASIAAAAASFCHSGRARFRVRRDVGADASAARRRARREPGLVCVGAVAMRIPLL